MTVAAEMKKTFFPTGLGVLLISLLLWPPVVNAFTINDRTVAPSKETTSNFIETLKELQKVNPTAKLHGLATFSRYLEPEERNLLAKKYGINVLEPYQNTTYWVSVTKPTKQVELQSSKLATALIALTDQDRVHPKIFSGSFDDFIATLPGDQPFNYVYQEGTLRLTVRFHADVSEAQAAQILQQYTQTVTKKSPVRWVVELLPTALKLLAKEDSVQWIEAGPLPYLPENNTTRLAIQVEELQNFTFNPANPTGPTNPSYSYNGSGVRIGIFDSGVDGLHPDFGGRVDPDDPTPPKDYHGTHMAGIVAGSGLQSGSPQGCPIVLMGSTPSPYDGGPYKWRGMAPAAGLIDRRSELFGDDVTEHQNLIASPGMQLSNHSYIISHFDGEYNDKEQDRDAMIRGSSATVSIPPRLSVFSAGNQGMAPKASFLYQKGYFSLTKQLKNGLIVGNWTAADDPEASLHTSDPRLKNRIFPDSSLGPTYDGRIKPDVVAPGAFIFSTAFPRTTYTSSSGSTCQDEYYFDDGTSQAAAATTGSIALLLQRYATVYGPSSQPLDLNTNVPLPSTLRALMIHTAEDIKTDVNWFSNADGPVKPTPGQDFVTGWGLVNTEKAKQVIDQKWLYESALLYTCSKKTFAFSVTSGDRLRITLGWDDYPGTRGPQTDIRDPKLVNDLDLVLIDPNGTRHYPWRLNQRIFDSSNVEITDNPTLESCTTPVTVTRQVNPIPHPSPSTNDPVPSDGFPPAVQDKTDHLNNVEVVDVPSPVTSPRETTAT
jgi:subtilisin family serine protease